MEKITLPEATSTNEYAQKLLETSRPANGCQIRAVAQTAGKGQKGNSWESEAGANLTCSVILFPDIDLHKQFAISEAVSLAVLDVIDEISDGFCIKWPNDIYHGQKKVAGILIECNLSGKKIDSCIVGLGLNVNQTKFLSDAPNPVSLAQIAQKTFDVEEISTKIHERIIARCAEIERDTNIFHAEYCRRLFRKDGFFRYKDEQGTFVARIHHIEPGGRMALETPDGNIQIYAFKEVSVVL